MARSQMLIAHLESGTEADALARLTAMFGELAGEADRSTGPTNRASILPTATSSI
ncbi:hypothetical protein [Sphingobium olei]|uniref:Uncharacterized protein n=1 Tax=Sphingobium olei TaxID=420955 RepID=A0ABW3P1K2_9SPHN